MLIILLLVYLFFGIDLAKNIDGVGIINVIKRILTILFWPFTTVGYVVYLIIKHTINVILGKS